MVSHCIKLRAAVAPAPVQCNACQVAHSSAYPCHASTGAHAHARCCCAGSVPAGVFDFKQSARIKEGDKLPMDATFLVLEEGASEPKAVKLEELIGGKKAVLFGLPGMVTMYYHGECAGWLAPLHHASKQQKWLQAFNWVAVPRRRCCASSCNSNTTDARSLLLLMYQHMVGPVRPE